LEQLLVKSKIPYVSLRNDLDMTLLSQQAAMIKIEILMNSYLIQSQLVSFRSIRSSKQTTMELSKIEYWALMGISYTMEKRLRNLVHPSPSQD